MHQTNESPASGELDWAKENDCLTEQSNNKSITSGRIVKHPSAPTVGGLRWRQARGLMTLADYVQMRRELTAVGASCDSMGVTAKSVTRPRQDRNTKAHNAPNSAFFHACLFCASMNPTVFGGVLGFPSGSRLPLWPILAGLSYPTTPIAKIRWWFPNTKETRQ